MSLFATTPRFLTGPRLQAMANGRSDRSNSKGNLKACLGCSAPSLAGRVFGVVVLE